MRSGVLPGLLCILACGSPLFCLAQHTSISGRVVDAATGTPLAFSNITLRGTSLGTVSNTLGEFDFHFPSGMAKDTLVVSYLGYGSFVAVVASLEGWDFLDIRLKPGSLLLHEVTVETARMTGAEIVEKAIARIPENYNTEPYAVDGFFREIEEENGKYVLLTEAALMLFDRGYGKGRPLAESVILTEGRQSTRYSARMDRDNPGYALADLLENNDVRYERGMLDTQTGTYALDSILIYDKRPVYVVSMRNTTDSGSLYIDTENYAFLSLTLERRSREHAKKYYQVFQGDTTNIGRVYFRFSVAFREFQGKLYAYRTHESELNEYYDRETGEVAIVATETLEFIATRVLPGAPRQGAKPLSYRTKLDVGEYHESFWASHNTLKLTPLNKKLIRDLEKEVSLNEQFRRKK